MFIEVTALASEFDTQLSRRIFFLHGFELVAPIADSDLEMFGHFIVGRRKCEWANLDVDWRFILSKSRLGTVWN
jgi:hypothetical protein